jgi:alkylation response protein AidB-like acyl-CoA dehydrogenase
MAAFFTENWKKDIFFNLKNYLNVESLCKITAFSEFSWDEFEQIVEEAIHFSEEELDSINKEGDQVGAQYKNGAVTMPESFKKAWGLYTESGWVGINMSPNFGGTGLPYTVSIACMEAFQAGNPAFQLFSGLTIGSGRLIEVFGTDELKSIFIEKMYSGEWTGTMCLTEPQAGSDLNLVKTKASKSKDHYEITGSKIFITCGDHDMTENIVHLVLARIDGAPKGTGGISLFAVPKIWVNKDGEIQGNNDVKIIGIEEKMGFHGSPTCAIEFEKSKAYLVGTENKGLSQMFQMMNEARILVGILSVAISSKAYSYSLNYAKERVQGAKLTNPKAGATRIIEHEDVRRMLIRQKSLSEGMRALAYKTAFYSDLALHSTSEEDRVRYEGYASLLVPLCKSYSSDRSWDLTRDAIQIFGGYGFIREYPVEQLARESKINSIWEGTNYIQALDLIGRKLPMQDGEIFKSFFEEHINVFTKSVNDEKGKEYLTIIKDAVKVLFETNQMILKWKTDKEEFAKMPWIATRFLDSTAEIVIGILLLEQYNILLNENTNIDEVFRDGKIHSIAYFMTNELPHSIGRLKIIRNSDFKAVSMAEESF